MREIITAILTGVFMQIVVACASGTQGVTAQEQTKGTQGVTAQEQTIDSQKQSLVLERISSDTVASILKSMGFEYQVKDLELKEANKKVSAHIFELAGYKVLANIGQDGRSLSLYSFWTNRDKKYNAETMNSWNSTRILSRAYIAKGGDITLASDLSLEGGITNDAIKTFIRRFRISLETFGVYLRGTTS
jgi:hypothetical protein